MQTWITDKDFSKSASNLNRHHLHANIYESIHILASLLDCTDKLVNPKRNVKNHPAAKLWKGYEGYLYFYIEFHLSAWHENGYESHINSKNLYMIAKQLTLYSYYMDEKNIVWITDELIQTHRSVLIQKEIKKDEDLNYKISSLRKQMNIKNYEKIKSKIEKLFKIKYYYRNTWIDFPKFLKMRYDWRSK